MSNPFYGLKLAQMQDDDLLDSLFNEYVAYEAPHGGDWAWQDSERWLKRYSMFWDEQYEIALAEAFEHNSEEDECDDIH